MSETRYAVLGTLINATTYEEVVAAVVEAAHENRALTVAAVAVHAVMEAVFNRAFRSRLNQLDWVVPDGKPIRWALRLLHQARLPDRVYGPTLTLKLCQAAAEHGLSVYFYGTTQETLESLHTNLLDRCPGLQIAGMHPSLFRQLTEPEQQTVDAHIRNSHAQIVFVGLGCPRQEIWMYEQREALGIPIIAVGAAFDFLSGQKSQAPEWMQRRGLEWLFRLIHEPRRLWRRYLVLNPLYLLLLVLQWMRLKNIDAAKDAVTQKFRYG